MAEGRGALPRRRRRSASTSATRTTTTASCSGCRRSGSAAAEAYRQAIAVNPLHAQAHNNLGQMLERQRQLDAAARRVSAGGRQPAGVPAGALQPRTHAARARTAGRSDRGAREADRAARRGSAALPVCAGDRARPRRPQGRGHQVGDRGAAARRSSTGRRSSPRRSRAIWRR